MKPGAPMAERWKIRISCPDCTGEDFQGCGEGFPWNFTSDEPPYDTAYFETKEAAQAKADALETERYGGIWDFTVERADG